MNVDDIVRRFPAVASVVGESWLHRNQSWSEDYIPPRLRWYEQLANDLLCVEQKIGGQNLVSSYRHGLRDPNSIQKTMFELHGAALMASTATSMRVHVPRGDQSGSNFDILAVINGHSVNAECKTRKDEFPFNLPRRSEGSEGITGYFGARATVDYHDAVALGLNPNGPGGDVDFKAIPESTVIRQILSDARAQLPEIGFNLILFGHIEGDREQLERALFGAEFCTLHKNSETRKVTAQWSRTPTGAFGAGPEGELFRALNGVLWFRLFTLGSFFGREYKFYLNPSTTCPLPQEVVANLEATMSQWTISQDTVDADD